MTNIEKTNLDDFVFERILQTQDFEEYWNTMHNTCSDDYPYELSKGEWDEQFVLWFQSKTTQH